MTLSPANGLPKLLVAAPVAQLDRASVFGTEGYRFKSCRVYSSSR